MVIETGTTAMPSRIDRNFRPSETYLTALPQSATPRHKEVPNHSLAGGPSWRKKLENIYASLLKSDFGKLMSFSEEKVAEIEKRHGASLIRRLNTESLVLKDGSKIPIGDLLLGTLGITDATEFRLNSKTKKAIDEVDLRKIQIELDDAEAQAKDFLIHFEIFQTELPDDRQTRDLTRNEAILVRNCCRYAAAAGETQDNAFELANWNIRQIRAIASRSNLSDSGRDVLVNRLNRNNDIVKERINPEEHSFMTRLQYFLYLSVEDTTKRLISDFKRNESWQHFTPDQRFDLPPHLIRA
jgi:hypothetical protein